MPPNLENTGNIHELAMRTLWTANQPARHRKNGQPSMPETPPDGARNARQNTQSNQLQKWEISMAHLYNDGLNAARKATIGGPNLRPAEPAVMSKLAGQIDDLMSKAAMAHDAGDRQLEASYTAKADTLRKASDPSAPLLTPDNGISVGQQLVDLAASYATQAAQARTSNSSKANAFASTSAALIARAGLLGSGA